MTKSEVTAILNRVSNLWPGAELNDDQIDLWHDTILGWEYELVMSAMNAFRLQPEAKFGPDIGQILTVARSIAEGRRARSAPPTHGAEFAQAQVHARQDQEARQAWILDQPQADQEAAMNWLALQDRLAQITGRVNPLAALARTGNRHRLAVMEATIRLRLWEQGDNWAEVLRNGEPTKPGTPVYATLP